jgi:hypothetical protein
MADDPFADIDDVLRHLRGLLDDFNTGPVYPEPEPEPAPPEPEPAPLSGAPPPDMPPDVLRMHKRVFGAQVKFDASGNPIEQGHGSVNHRRGKV